MIKKNCLIVLSILLTASAFYPQDKKIQDLIDKELPSLITTYKLIHSSPELSGNEKNTAALVAKELRSIGFTVKENVGKYDDPNLPCYGIVGILKNGDGPTVLVRTEFDALPIEEKTNLPYESKVKVKNNGVDVSVMHACGHDIHIASLLGTAKLLVSLKNQWKGTLVLIGQPAEETLAGAKAMLKDNLYSMFNTPDYVLALHTIPESAGSVGYCPEYFNAGVASVDLIIRGIGGHGAKPELAKDPIVIAAQIILALQTIVSRENSPLDPAVVTVGSIHGGTKYNIIPDEVHLQLTIRAYKEDVKKKILSSIERISKNIALAAGVQEDNLPVMTVKESGPASYNNIELSQRIGNIFVKTFGQDKVLKIPPYMVSEDFGNYSLDDHKIPGFYFYIGINDPSMVADNRKKGINLPGNHSSLFAPLPEPTISTGIKAMTVAVLDLMKK
jgi:amidohydrolase